ncbi:MAG TPA: Gfo/Idh/MocA family oxidoreductase [Bryobacteraceae bacterium]|nr:Gfo/Idh/MocA family oxidoreductase [Bryobacteraceae bacterium]
MQRSWLITLLLVLPLTAQDLRLGIIGTDTSHVPAFTGALNDASSPEHISGARIVAAYKGGSPDLANSAKRVNQYANDLHDKWGVTLVNSIAELCPVVDGLLLESVDGRPHLAQFREAAKCGKPVFIDKPLSSSLADALEIARLAKEAHIPWFSASSLRYSGIEEMRSPDMTGAIVWAPGPMEPHHQLDLTWYGIHGVEMLYTLFGPGCVEVSRLSSPNEEVITGRWKNGRLGTIHLQRPYGKYGAVVFLKDQKLDSRPDMKFSYVTLAKQIVEFMQTKIPAVPNDVTLEMFEFMDAAQKSVAAGGKAMPVLQQ